MKNARRKLEGPMPAAMPCKFQREKYRETCRVDECKTNMLLLSKLTSPREFVWKELLIGIMRIILQQKE